MNMRKRAVGRSWKTSYNSSCLYAKEALPPPLIDFSTPVTHEDKKEEEIILTSPCEFLAQNALHEVGVWADACPEGECLRALHDEHSLTVDRRAAMRRCRTQKCGLGGGIDEVVDGGR